MNTEHNNGGNMTYSMDDNRNTDFVPFDEMRGAGMGSELATDIDYFELLTAEVEDGSE